MENYPGTHDTCVFYDAGFLLKPRKWLYYYRFLRALVRRTQLRFIFGRTHFIFLRRMREDTRKISGDLHTLWREKKRNTVISFRARIRRRTNKGEKQKKRNENCYQGCALYTFWGAVQRVIAFYFFTFTLPYSNDILSYRYFMLSKYLS